MNYLGIPKAICVFPCEISQFIVSLIGPTLPFKIQRLIEDDNRKLLLRAEMLNDRGDVVVRRIYLFGDVNHFTGKLPLAVFNKGPQTLRHVVLPEKL